MEGWSPLPDAKGIRNLTHARAGGPVNRSSSWLNDDAGFERALAVERIADETDMLGTFEQGASLRFIRAWRHGEAHSRREAGEARDIADALEGAGDLAFQVLPVE